MTFHGLFIGFLDASTSEVSSIVSDSKAGKGEKERTSLMLLAAAVAILYSQPVPQIANFIPDKPQITVGISA